MNLKRNEVEHGLKRKGFEKRDNDHRYLTLYVDGRKEVSTKVGQGDNFDIRSDEIGFMAKQLGITNQNFIDLVKCPLSVEKYLKIRKERLDNINNILKILKRG
ncbi:MAG: hypothetical protein ACYDHX_09770 [Methanothrix sp.]